MTYPNDLFDVQFPQKYVHKNNNTTSHHAHDAYYVEDFELNKILFINHRI